MRERLETIAGAFARRPWLPLIPAVALLAAGGFHAARLGVDPGNEALFLRDDPARAAHAVFEERFGGDEIIVVALQGEGVLSEAGLRKLDALTDAIAEVEGVAEAISLTNARNVYQERWQPEINPWPPYAWVEDEDRDVAWFREEVLGEPLFVGNLVSADEEMTAVIVTLEHRGEKIVEALRALAREASGEGIAAHVAGFPVERYDFARLIREDQQVFIPLVVVTIAVLCGMLFRQPWGVALPLAVVGFGVAVTMGLAAALGRDLNAVTSLLTPVVMVVSVAVSVNLCSAYTWERERTGPGAPGIAAAYGRIGTACLFTTFTTFVGFGSLAVSEVPAVRDFGGLCAFGVAFSYVAALLVLPAAFGIPGRFAPQRLRARPGALERALTRLGHAIASRRRVVLLVAAVVLGGAGVGLRRLQVETDILSQLPPKSDLAVATRAIDAHLGGVNTIELLLQGEAGTFRDLEALRALARVQDRFAGRAEQGVTKTFSLIDILERIHQVKVARRDPEKARRELPPDQETLDYYFGILERAGDAAPTKLLLTDDAAIARLTVRVRAIRASHVYAIMQQLQAAAAEEMPEGVRPRLAGQYVLIQNMTHELPLQQMRGLVIATIVIVGAIAVLFRSLALGALAAIPAAIPILSVYGIMGWSGIYLSTATSMIASVALGLAVDSTILLLSGYRDRRAQGVEPVDAIASTLATSGQAVTYSNLTLVCGFATSALSGFPPVRDFGILTAAAIAMSWMGAIFVLPALILLRGGAAAPPAGAGTSA